MGDSNRKYKNFGEYVFWIYANLNMYMAAIASGKRTYDRQCFMVRAKAFKAYKEGRWKIHSLYEDNNWKMDRGKDECWYCGEPIERCGKLTAEHILPRSRGGDDSFDNIAYACKSCNSSKGDTDLIEWFYMKKKLVPPVPLLCIYMKLVYKYAVENNLMELHGEDMEGMDLPFNYKSLAMVEFIIKEEFLRLDAQQGGEKR